MNDSYGTSENGWLNGWLILTVYYLVLGYFMLKDYGIAYIARLFFV